MSTGLQNNSNNNNNKSKEVAVTNKSAFSIAVSSTKEQTNEPQQQQDEESTGLSFNKSLFQLKKFASLAILNSFTGFSFGWDVGTAGGIVNFPSFKSRFGSVSDVNGLHTLDPWVVGCIISMFNLGCALGGMGLSKIADKVGRRATVLIGCVIYAIGTIVQISSKASSAWAQVLAGRIISGLAIGLFSVVTPMLISECSPVSIRGELVVFFQLFITLGILAGNITNFACKSLHGGEDAEWMIPIGLNFAWLLIIIAGTAFMYESPSYLLAQGREQESAQTTKSIHGITDASPQADVAYVEDLVEKRSNENYTMKQATDEKALPWHEFITGKPKLGRRLVIGMCVMMFQQLSGANYFFYYGTTLFASVGLDDAYVTAIILGAVNFVSTFAGIYAVGKFGRKTCLLAGSGIMGISMLVYAILGSFFLMDNATGIAKPSIGGAMIAFTCIYIFGFASTWGPVAFVVVSELFPSRTRAIAMACSVAMNWISNFLISLLTPTIITAIGFKYGFVFAGCLLASFFVVLFFLKETKHSQTDEDTDKLYAGELEKIVAAVGTEATGFSSHDSSVLRLQDDPDAKAAEHQLV